MFWTNKVLLDELIYKKLENSLEGNITDDYLAKSNPGFSTNFQNFLVNVLVHPE